MSLARDLLGARDPSGPPRAALGQLGTSGRTPTDSTSPAISPTAITSANSGVRGHALPEVTGLFAENISRFDCCWYGLHEVTSTILERFTRNVDQIKAQT